MSLGLQRGRPEARKGLLRIGMSLYLADQVVQAIRLTQARLGNDPLTVWRG